MNDVKELLTFALGGCGFCVLIGGSIVTLAISEYLEKRLEVRQKIELERLKPQKENANGTAAT